jgi:hypothetical protein
MYVGKPERNRRNQTEAQSRLKSAATYSAVAQRSIDGCRFLTRLRRPTSAESAGEDKEQILRMIEIGVFVTEEQ